MIRKASHRPAPHALPRSPSTASPTQRFHHEALPRTPAERRAHPADGFDAHPTREALKRPSATGHSKGGATRAGDGHSRPQIDIKKGVPVEQQANGKSGGSVRGKWAVSAVAGNHVVLYNPNHDGDIRVVNKQQLEHAVSGADRKTLQHALHARRLPETSQQPAGTPLHANPQSGIPYAPVGGASRSMTGRGGAMWGVTSPNGKQGSHTGFAAMPLHQGDEFIPAGPTKTTTWYGKTRGKEDRSKKARATYTLGYVKDPDGHWAKEWVVTSVAPTDGSTPISTMTA